MKEITKKEAFDETCQVRVKKQEKNKKVALFWWKHFGASAIKRAVKRGKFTQALLIPVACSSEICDLLRERKYEIYTYKRNFLFSEIVINWL